MKASEAKDAALLAARNHKYVKQVLFIIKTEAQKGNTIFIFDKNECDSELLEALCNFSFYFAHLGYTIHINEDRIRLTV